MSHKKELLRSLWVLDSAIMYHNNKTNLYDSRLRSTASSPSRALPCCRDYVSCLELQSRASAPEKSACHH